MLITPEIVSTELQERAGRDPVLSSRYGRMCKLVGDICPISSPPPPRGTLRRGPFRSRTTDFVSHVTGRDRLYAISFERSHIAVW